ncbi:hypothetical protein KL921_002657 [Ogataea angusta]|nr:hypothetical protein KL921_002657 [Ogataea angusta]KAG7829566.1 hypothetical protein KL920_002425 [Ogataea angusta]
MTFDKEHNTDLTKVRVFIVRHGQTSWNNLKILQGHKDVPLNDRGLEQARFVGLRMKDLDIDEFVSSDLSRCVQTMNEITSAHREKPNFKLRYTSNLRERSMGPVEGMPLSEAKEKYGAQFKEMGETRVELLTRLQNEWNRIIDEATSNGYTNVLICTHGGVITNFTNHLYKSCAYTLAPGLQEEDLKVPSNTSVTIIDVDKSTGKGIILRFGSAEHLHGHVETVDQDLR